MLGVPEEWDRAALGGFPRTEGIGKELSKMGRPLVDAGKPLRAWPGAMLRTTLKKG